MDILKIFQSIGLDEKETKIYLCLLRNIKSIIEISKSTKISRAAIYPILERLEKKEFIIQKKENNKLIIIAKQPDEILKQLKYKHNQFESILEDLKKFSQTCVHESIQTIACKTQEEIERELVNIYTSTNETLYSYGNYDICIELFKYQALKLRKIRKEKNIFLHVKAFASTSPKLYKNNDEENVIFELKKQFKETNNYILFNSETVCIHTLQNKQLKCVIIKDKEYANFNKIVWKKL